MRKSSAVFILAQTKLLHKDTGAIVLLYLSFLMIILVQNVMMINNYMKM